MPGAPNRPPETTPPKPTEPPAGLDGAARKALRRLVPSRAALLLDLWKQAVPSELHAPYARAEAAYAAREYPAAENHLDQLAVRFAEPRWPTLPEPFRGLRVSIPRPEPPHWDPDHALPVTEKESKRLRQHADLQVALATATLGWMGAHAIAIDDLSAALDRATERLARDGPTDDFWLEIDRLWSDAHPRLPAPKVAGGRGPAPAAAADQAGAGPA